MEVRKTLSMENVANNLVRVRTGMGVSQQEAARLMEVPEQEFARYEAAQEPIAATSLFLLAHGLGIGVDSFFIQAQ